jgi:hypothetical protein
MTLDTNWCEKAKQLLIKARDSSWGNTGSTPLVQVASPQCPMNLQKYRYCSVTGEYKNETLAVILIEIHVFASIFGVKIYSKLRSTE